MRFTLADAATYLTERAPRLFQAFESQVNIRNWLCLPIVVKARIRTAERDAKV
jgi:hypothetical protein